MTIPSILKMFRLFILNLCVCFFVWIGSAGASCLAQFNKFFQSKEKQSPPVESVQAASSTEDVNTTGSLFSSAYEEASDINMETLTRDAVGGVVGSLAIDAIVGEEITPTGIVTDAAIGAGTGTALRVVAPDVAREIDNFVDDTLSEVGGFVDDMFGDW